MCMGKVTLSLLVLDHFVCVQPPSSHKECNLLIIHIIYPASSLLLSCSLTRGHVPGWRWDVPGRRRVVGGGGALNLHKKCIKLHVDLLESMGPKLHWTHTKVAQDPFLKKSQIWNHPSVNQAWKDCLNATPGSPNLINTWPFLDYEPQCPCEWGLKDTLFAFSLFLYFHLSACPSAVAGGANLGTTNTYKV